MIQRNFPAPAWLDLKTFAPQPFCAPSPMMKGTWGDIVCPSELVSKRLNAYSFHEKIRQKIAVAKACLPRDRFDIHPVWDRWPPNDRLVGPAQPLMRGDRRSAKLMFRYISRRMRSATALTISAPSCDGST